MWEIIVLGQVPGTSLQVSFETWLSLIAGLFIVVTYLRYRRRLHDYLLVSYIGLNLRLRRPRIRPAEA